MNCFSVGKQNDSQKLALFGYLFPLAYPTVRLNLRMGWIINRILNPQSTRFLLLYGPAFS